MITRNWLKALGASTYLAKRLTQPLTVSGHEGRAYAYEAEAVMASVLAYQQNSRIRPNTKQLLVIIATALEECISLDAAASPGDNAARAPLDPLAAAMAKVSQANQQFEETAKAARKVSSDFETYRSQRGQDFKSRNNVVTFA